MKEHSSSISFVAGITVGVLLSGAWFLGGARDFLPSASFGTASTTANTAEAAPPSKAISVSDQPAGSSVTVASVDAPSSGVWVAVREVNGRDLGNVLGAVRVKGAHAQVEVPLLRATEADRAYAIELYRDDGSGSFDPMTYSVYVDFDTGAPAVAYFRTTL
jgi:hypothetical protein